MRSEFTLNSLDTFTDEEDMLRESGKLFIDLVVRPNANASFSAEVL